MYRVVDLYGALTRKVVGYILIPTYGNHYKRKKQADVAVFFYALRDAASERLF